MPRLRLSAASRASNSMSSVTTESGIGSFGSGNGLEHQVDRRALFDQLDGVGDVGEHAGLGRDLVAAAQLVEHVEQRPCRRDVVGCRIDADHRIANAIGQTIENRCRDATQVVGRMIGLQARADTSGQAERVAESARDFDLARHGDEIAVAHQLADCRRHFRGKARREPRQDSWGRSIGQQPVPECADCHVCDRRKSPGVMAVDDQAGDLVRLVGHHGLVEKMLERDIGKSHLRRDALDIGLRRDPRQRVAGPLRRGNRHQRGKRVKAVGLATERGAECCHETTMAWNGSRSGGARSARSPCFRILRQNTSLLIR